MVILFENFLMAKLIYKLIKLFNNYLSLTFISVIFQCYLKNKQIQEKEK